MPRRSREYIEVEGLQPQGEGLGVRPEATSRDPAFDNIH